MAAHQALTTDGSGHEALDEVVRHREASVDDVLGLFRELHLAATTQAPSPRVQETLERLKRSGRSTMRRCGVQPPSVPRGRTQ